jgi:uncharacterized protein (TIRG00374 family)
MAILALARNYWKYLKPIVLVGLLISFFLVVPIQGILHSLATTNMALFVLSLFLSLPVSYLAAFTLWILARKQGIQISTWEIFKINFIIKFYSFFSPASFLGGGLRWYQLSRGGKSAEALSAVTMDRALDVFAAVVMGLFWFLAGIRRNTVNPLALVALIALMVVAWLVVTRLSPTLAAWTNGLAERAKAAWMRRVLLFAGRLLNTLKGYTSLSLLEILALAGASLLSEVISLIIQVILAMSLQISISPFDLGWMRAVSFLASLAPVTLVGGLGLSDVSTVLLMTGLGVSTELATAFAFLVYARSAVLSLMGGVAQLFTDMRRPAEDPS